MAQLDLMFSVGDLDCIQQAILAFDEPVEAEFPLDDLNAALGSYYQATLTLPWITTIRDMKGPIGYLLTPRNDRLSDREAAEMFWDTLQANDMANAEAGTFLVDQPCWANVPGAEPTVALGYIVPYGPDLPVDAINFAIRTIMGQGNWPEDGAIYIYPVKKHDDPLYCGLWLADHVDNMAEDSFVDDAIFKSIREQNLVHKKRNPDPYQRKRYSW
jgi:hypothetical protein